jgi:SNF2 family DNA or RNA helicase
MGFFGRLTEPVFFSGGVGLNLTAASRMLLLDPAWNPATEEQCFDRIHRLGQDQDVVVTKFVMADR